MTNQTLYQYVINNLSSFVQNLSTRTIFSITRSAFESSSKEDIILWPIFGSNGFPITIAYTEGTAEQVQQIYHELLGVSDKLSQEDCEKYNQQLLQRGFVRDIQVPLNLKGECVKAFDPETKRCKVSKDKFSCMGCGKSWVPMSYMSKTCKTHPNPDWFEPLKYRINPLMAEHGVSTTAPLVWANNNVKRVFVPKK